MTNTIDREAQLLVAENRRNEAAAHTRREVERLQVKLAEYAALSGDRLIALFYPFEEGLRDVLRVRCGVAIEYAQQSAQELADLLCRPVSFEFNKRTHTTSPAGLKKKGTGP